MARTREPARIDAAIAGDKTYHSTYTCVRIPKHRKLRYTRNGECIDCNRLHRKTFVNKLTVAQRKAYYKKGQAKRKPKTVDTIPVPEKIKIDYGKVKVIVLPPQQVSLKERIFNLRFPVGRH